MNEGESGCKLEERGKVWKSEWGTKSGHQRKVSLWNDLEGSIKLIDMIFFFMEALC